MNKKKLLIIHSEKKINIEEKGVSYINIGGGIVESRASKKITLNQFRKTFYQKYKKLLIQKLSNKANIAEKKFSHVNELEIFNLRNDKNTNIDLILNTLIIGEIIEKKNFTKIELITDNSYVNKIFKDAFPFIEIRYSKKNITKFNLTFLKILKFYIKTLSVIIYLKIFYRQKKITKVFKEACLSLYPIFYKSNNESFFNDNNKIKFNFLLTDETHLNFSLLDITKAIKKNKNSESVHVESFISFKSLFYSMCKSIFFYFISFRLNFNLRLKNLDLSFFYKDYFFSSLINRCKLNIYEDSFLLALKKFNIKRFNLYLFEYNFGFFLTNLIKKKNKRY